MLIDEGRSFEDREGIMAIAVVYTPPAMNAEQYKASWGGSERPPVAIPPGLLFHAGVGEGETFFTVTIWQSREDYDAFVPTFKRTMSERGFQFGEPVVLPVHHYIAP